MILSANAKCLQVRLPIWPAGAVPQGRRAENAYTPPAQTRLFGGGLQHSSAFWRKIFYPIRGKEATDTDIAAFKTRLRSGHPDGWYLFCGEEDYLKQYYLAALRDTVLTDPGFAAFNHIVFDGAEIDFGALRDAVKAPPMMAEYKLVEWRYADFEHMREGARSALEELARARGDYPYTVVVFLTSEEGFDPGTPKRPSKLYTRLSGALEILNFTKSTPAQLLSWLAKHFEAEGVRAGADALNALLFRSGHSMRVLLNEVSKLSAYVKANGRDTLTVRDVEEVSVSNPECDAFALTNAITDRDLPGALRALEDMKRRRVEPTAVLGMMSRTFAELLSVSLLLEEGRDAQDMASLLKINPYKIKIYIAAARRRTPATLQEAMETLLRADADSKSGGVSGWCAVESFVAQNT